MPTKTPNPQDITILVTPGCASAAAYVGDTLLTMNDFTDVAEQVLEALGVTIEHDNSDFLRTGKRGEHARTLTEANDWPADRDRVEAINLAREQAAAHAASVARAADLRTQAQALLAEADTISPQS